MTSGNRGAPSGATATDAVSGCLTLTGTATGQAGQGHGAVSDGSGQLSGGHGGEGVHRVGCELREL